MSDAPPPGLIAMRRTAGLLLVAMSVLFVVATLQQHAHPFWGYARAFAEAAMVGGLADWFAVTAIFRRPLGLPIPHTAVIPKSKERIAIALGDFIADNFLAPENVAARLEGADLAGALARQCSDPRQAEGIATAILDAAPAVLDAFDDEAIAAFLRKQAAHLAEDGRIAPTLGSFLHLATEQGRHHDLIDAALEEGWRALIENQSAIRGRVRSQTGWLWRVIGLDGRASDALISSLETTLRDVANDPNHPLRTRVTEMLHRFARDLEESPEVRAKVQRAAQDILSHPSVAERLGEAWGAAKAALRREASKEVSPIRDVIRDAIVRFCEDLLVDDAARGALNRRLRDAVVAFAATYGASVSRLATDTIRSWDTETIVIKLEQSVGRDLQYVRINGTVIGGLVGLTLHQLSHVLPAIG
ncbi:MAG: DUF445 domain-containing protein [Caulobacterales bacterium]